MISAASDVTCGAGSSLAPSRSSRARASAALSPLAASVTGVVMRSVAGRRVLRRHDFRIPAEARQIVRHALYLFERERLEPLAMRGRERRAPGIHRVVDLPREIGRVLAREPRDLLLRVPFAIPAVAR